MATRRIYTVPIDPPMKSRCSELATSNKRSTNGLPTPTQSPFFSTFVADLVVRQIGSYALLRGCLSAFGNHKTQSFRPSRSSTVVSATPMRTELWLSLPREPTPLIRDASLHSEFYRAHSIQNQHLRLVSARKMALKQLLPNQTHGV